jgi:hypothetical protein
MIPRNWTGDLVTSYGGYIRAGVYYRAESPVARPFEHLPVFAIFGDNEMELLHYADQLVASDVLYAARLHEVCLFDDYS